MDTNADHFAAWRLDLHGNPVGEPRRFDYDLPAPPPTGTRRCGTPSPGSCTGHDARRAAIAIEDLDFADEKTREKHGRRKRFRQADLRHAHRQAAGPGSCRWPPRLGIPIVAVDPAYTSKWGAQHWQKPLSQQEPEDHPP